MPTYLMLVNLTDQGAKGVKDIPKRKEAARKLAGKLKIQRRAVFMTMGQYDFVHIYDAPNAKAMAQFVLTLGSYGNIRTTTLRAFNEDEHTDLITRLP